MRRIVMTSATQTASTRVSAMWIGAMTLVALLGLAGVAVAQTAPEVFRFDGGAEVRGKVVKETPEKVFIDIGFTVLAVEKKHVRERTKAKRAEEPAEQRQSIFFTKKLPRSPIQQIADRFGGGVVMVRTPTGQGSGFIIDDEQGFVVTNFHVIEGDTRISVTMFKREKDELKTITFDDVRIVALSPFFDLALIKIEKFEKGALSKVYLGDIQELSRGDKVFTLGNPLGLSRSVTEGIVSTRFREQEGKVAIQTTAPSIPGNSGGPLFNDRGEVVGVTSSKLMGVGIEGIGFAIPVNYVIDFLVNREAFAYDKKNPNTGIRYFDPPTKRSQGNQ